MTVTLVAVGTCAIQAMQPGIADYAPAAPVVQRFEVTQPVRYAISNIADYELRHRVLEINPTNGSIVQQLFVSWPADPNGTYLGVGGLAWQ